MPEQCPLDIVTNNYVQRVCQLICLDSDESRLHSIVHSVEIIGGCIFGEGECLEEVWKRAVLVRAVRTVRTLCAMRTVRAMRAIRAIRAIRTISIIHTVRTTSSTANSAQHTPHSILRTAHTPHSRLRTSYSAHHTPHIILRTTYSPHETEALRTPKMSATAEPCAPTRVTATRARPLREQPVKREGCRLTIHQLTG